MVFDCRDAIEAEAVELSKPFPHVIEAEAVGQSDPLPNYIPRDSKPSAVVIE